MDFCEFLKGLVVVFDECIKKIAFLTMRSILQIVPEGLFDSAKQATDPLLNNLIFCYIFVFFLFYVIDFAILKISVKNNQNTNIKNMSKPTPDMTAIPFGTSVLYVCGRDNKMIYQSIVEKTQVPGIVAQIRRFGHIVYAGDQLYPEAVYYYGLPTGGFKVTVHSMSDGLQLNLKTGRSNTCCEFVVREKGLLNEAKLREILDERRRSLNQVELWDYDIVPVPDGTRADFTLGNIFSAACFSNIN